MFTISAADLQAFIAKSVTATRSSTKPAKPTIKPAPRLPGESKPFIPRVSSINLTPPRHEARRVGPDSVSFTTQQLIDEHRRRELSALAALQKERHFITYYSQFMANILGA